MKRNEYLENELEKLKKTCKTEASWDVLRGYKESLENGNERLNIHRIDECCFGPIVETLKNAGIESFTVSDSSTDAMMNLMNLSVAAKIVDFVAVRAPWHNINDEWDVIPAALFEL